MCRWAASSTRRGCQGLFRARRDWQPLLDPRLDAKAPPDGRGGFHPSRRGGVVAGEALYAIGDGRRRPQNDFGEWAPADGRYHDGTPGAQAHNLYPLLYNRAVYEVLNEHSAGQGLVWSRATTAGGQRYRSIGVATAVHLRAHGGQPARWSEPVALWLCLLEPRHRRLYPRKQPALYARWAQFGLFCSHARAHGNLAA